ncbi:protein LYK5-like [Fagus crenata]
MKENPKSTKLRNFHTAGSVASVSLVLVALAACGLYVKALKKLKCEKFHCRSSPISINSCLSPDILVEIKYSLFMYSTEDLKKATNDFGEESKIVMIQQTRFENTRQVIDLHSKIITSILTQIAFDIATGLHYLHLCTFLPLAHISLSSRNIFVTANWRAKLANIGIGPMKENDNKNSLRGWAAPEDIQDGPACAKVDIFAFGVILLEREGGCFEQLRGFMDPTLKEDYPLAEALCLAVLAKACVEDDPLHRPSMDDIMEVLAKMA